MTKTWRYIAQKLNGDGTGSFLDYDLPLRDVQLTRTLSGPARLTGKLAPEVARLIVGNQPVLKEWSTAIYAEADGHIRGGGILATSTFDGADWALDCVGFTGYATDLPYLDQFYGVQVDPLDMVRKLWDHIQAQPDGNIGLDVDPLTSPVRIGTPLTNVEFETGAGEDVSFEAGPFKIAWWVTDDIGAKIDELAKETPFDYIEEHDWSGPTITHRLRLGYPRLGTRRHDLRFVYGENVLTTPTIDVDGEEYANEILALGAGEGRDMKRAIVTGPHGGRLRRMTMVSDKALRSKTSLTSFARRQLSIHSKLEDVTELEVRDHPQAPVGAYDAGDEIRVQGDTGWADVDLWARITAITIEPEAGDAVKLSLIRSDRVGEET